MKQSQLRSGILLGLGKRPSMRSRPVANRGLRKEYAYCKGGLPVGRNVKNEFRRWRARVTRQSSPLPDKIVLIHVSLAAGIGFHATQGHVVIGMVVSKYCAVMAALTAAVPGGGRASVRAGSRQAGEHAIRLERNLAGRVCTLR